MRWTRQSRLPIDTAATMPDGTKLAGPEDLHKALAARGDRWRRSSPEKLMTYAVGRHVDPRDMPSVRRIVHTAATNSYRFEDIVLGVVNSDAFRRREAPVELPKSTTAQAAISFPHPFHPYPEGPGDIAMFLTKKHLSRRTS